MNDDTDAARISGQDAALARQFFAFVAGAGGEYGAEAPRELARLVARMRDEEGISFGGYVARLIQADAASRGW